MAILVLNIIEIWALSTGANLHNYSRKAPIKGGMTQALFNPGLIAMAAQVPLLSSPWRPSESPAQEIAEAFSYAEVPIDDVTSDVMPIVDELRRLSPEWNACYYDGILRGHAEGLGDVGSVKERLAAEVRFYKELYSRRPEDSYLIHPVDKLVLDKCLIDVSAVVFASGGEIYGCADFISMPGALIIDYILGYSKTTSAEQRKLFGRAWFEIFMERTIAAYAHLRDIGVDLLLSIEWEHLRLPRMVRDRYFESHPVGSKTHYPLNYKRARVKRALGAA
jgi:hypothetical protein